MAYRGDKTMAASPQYKVYDSDGKYQGAVKDIAAGLVLVSFYGDGATLRRGHAWKLWTEGDTADGIGCEDYDKHCDIIDKRQKR